MQFIFETECHDSSDKMLALCEDSLRFHHTHTHKKKEQEATSVKMSCSFVISYLSNSMLDIE